MRALAAILVLGSLCVVSASPGAVPAPNVRGTVIRVPSSGGCYPGEACDPLPPALYIVFSRGSTTVRARLAASGAFSMHLAPGKYTVTVAPPTGLLAPGSITVPRVGTIRPRLVERHR
jgi:hypothetical protein